MRKKKLMAFGLAVLMIVSLIPTTVFSEKYGRSVKAPTIVLAGSDFQAVGGDSYSQANVSAILSQIKVDYPAADGLIFCGDYDKDLPSKNIANSVNALKSTVEGAFGTDIDEVFVQGNHDQQTPSASNGLSGTGAHDNQNYGVYVLDEDDYQWGSYVNESKIRTAASNLGSYLDAKVEEGYTKPIFIASHVPLHYTARTYKDKDGLYAKYIFDEINEAAEDLSIIFLYGHDHSQGFDNYMGGAASYHPAGDTINIAVPTDTSRKTYTVEDLNFTYMNAGFVGYYADWEPGKDGTSSSYPVSGVDNAITMTCFEITDTQVKISRYGTDGIHNLKSVGVNSKQHASDEATINITPDTSEYASGQILALKVEEVIDPEIDVPTEPEEPETPEEQEFTDESTGVKITCSNGTAATVEVLSNTTEYDGIEKYVLYDITVDGFTNGEDTATVSLPLPENYDVTRTHVYHVEDGNLTDMNARYLNGELTFETTHFSEYMVGEIEDDASELDWKYFAAQAGSFAGAYPATSLKNGDKVIIRSVQNTNYYLTNYVSASGTNNGLQLTTDWQYNAYRWTVEVKNGTTRLKDDNGQYLYIGNNTATMSSNYTNSVTLVSGQQYWEISSTRNSNTYYLNQYGGSSNTRAAGWNQGASNDPGSRWYIYAATDSTPAYYASFSGGNRYSIPTSEFNNELDLQDYIKENIKVWKASDDEGTGKTEITDYTLSAASTINPTVAGDFTYNVIHNNVSLGTISVNLYDEHQDTTGWVKYTGTGSGQTQYVYTLVTSIESGKNYLIAANGSATILSPAGGSLSAQPVTITNNTITLTTDTHDFLITSTGTADQYTIQDGSYYLRRNSSNALSYTTTNSRNTWTITRDGTSNNMTISNAGSFTTYYLYGGEATSDWYLGTRSNTKRFFKLTETIEPQSEYYLKIEGNQQYTFSVTEFADEAALKSFIQQNVTLKKADNANGTNAETVNYTLTGTANPTQPGTYTYTINYDGKQVGSITTTFTTRTVARIAPNVNFVGMVSRESLPTAKTGAKLAVYYSDGTMEYKDITLNMLSGDYDVTTAGTYDDLTVTYEGVSIQGFQLIVLPKPEENDYPDYPDPGAVRVNKSGKGLDFDETGVAKVELSTAGIPESKGVDVIVMVDTSSSMTYGAQAGTTTASSGNQRIDYLRNSLRAMLENFRQPNEDGSRADVRLALADFNGYTMINSDNQIDGTQAGSRANDGKIFTGSNTIGTGAFEQVGQYTDSQITTLVNKVTAKSGTNYDYAFDTIYRLGTAIKAQNEAQGEDRDLFVIFMSDGCPYQYNYFSGSPTATNANWNAWLLGKYITYTGSNNNVTVTPGADITDPTSIITKTGGQNYAYFFNAATNNSHRMADAVKGNPELQYEVIDPTNSLGTASSSGKNYMRSVPGLGARVYSIAFCLYDDNKIDSEVMKNTISRLASGDQYFFNVQGTDVDTATNVQKNLDRAFTQISQSTKLAATKARFIDKLGSEYDIQMASSVEGGLGTVNLSDHQIQPQIRILSYDIYRSTDVGYTIDGHTVTKDDVGKRYGDPVVLETVTFNAAGTSAYSDKLGSDVNILKSNGVIEAQNFWYNTNKTGSVHITPETAGEDGYDLEAETFYWEIGNLENNEFVMEYYVYLEGSMEGTRPGGSYPTNESAPLYYTNWLGNEAHLDTVSPVLSWGEANVSYAFYLVDEDGNVIVNVNSMQTGSFTNKIPVTNPVMEQLLLNTQTSVSGKTITAEDVLPEGFELYDPSATYTITIPSGQAGNWLIHSDSSLKDTTYVTGYNGSDYTTNKDVDNSNYEYTHTTVWFAVKFVIGPVPDTVVVDYGLPVSIDVIKNDMFGSYGNLYAIGPWSDTLPKKSEGLLDGFAGVYGGNYGSAIIKNDFVQYNVNTMNFNGVEKFAYAVLYLRTDEGYESYNGYYYSSVTVIPATIVYYEDTFMSYPEGSWEMVGANDVIKEQSQDRPGEFSMPEVDANNIYGYDPVYGNYTTYGLGGAHKTTVSRGNDSVAQFTFYGTAFDVISQTDNSSGVIYIDVYSGDEVDDDNWEKSTVVQNHFETTDGIDTLYQVPVMKIKGLPYGQHTVTITAAYSAPFDKTGTGSYTFILDAIRIYDPAKNDATAIQAYKDDNEYLPSFSVVRNLLVNAETLSSDETLDGVCFVETDEETNESELAQYADIGPNNECYLAHGQSIAFDVTVRANRLKTVQLAMKASTGVPTATVLVKKDGKVVRKDIVVDSTTDRYYDLSNGIDFSTGGTYTVVVTNAGLDLLSLTNLKTTTDPSASMMMSMSPKFSATTLNATKSMLATVYVAEAPAENETVLEETVKEDAEKADAAKDEETKADEEKPADKAEDAKDTGVNPEANADKAGEKAEDDNVEHAEIDKNDEGTADPTGADTVLTTETEEGPSPIIPIAAGTAGAAALIAAIVLLINRRRK